jgi:hypothetical protein
MAARAGALASVKARMAKPPRASVYASIWRLCRGYDAWAHVHHSAERGSRHDRTMSCRSALLVEARYVEHLR